MSAPLRVTIDAATVSPSKAITAAVRGTSLVVLTARIFGELAAELGSTEAAMRRLLRVCERVNKPIGVNFPSDNGSRTVFLAPRSWTQERLRGWVGGRHQDIADAFGPATPSSGEDL